MFLQKKLALFLFLACGLPGILPAQTTSDSMTDRPAADSGIVHLLYTGKFLGYFRFPDAEAPDPLTSCPDDDEKRPSLAAQRFGELIASHKLEKVILVGMGDNFAPEVEARKFCIPPANQYKPDRFPYDRSGKEFFVWDGTAWRTNEYVSKKHDTQAQTLETQLAEGQGSIPTDNVAGFFINQGYAAVVPGKHDFYYGAERLRELAKYLATTPIANSHTLHEGGVQMLGANLVIESTWKNGHEPLSDKKAPPWFIPRFPTATDLVGNANDEINFSGIAEGGSVYPWFAGPHVSLKTSTPELARALEAMTYTRCKLKDGGDLDRPPSDCIGLELVKSEDANTLLKNDSSQPNAVSYQVLFHKNLWETLESGANYLFCAEGRVTDQKLTDKEGGHHFCLHFSTYQPLFQYPAKGAAYCIASEASCQTPQPFVLVEQQAGLAEDVAIFGAIDPHLAEYIGLLNLSWKNTKDGYNTKAAIRDPAEALRQMNEYFELNYQQGHGKKFKGIKVLLAQMSPEAAEILAARLGNYQVVVSEADPERSTYDHTTQLDWAPTGLVKKNQTKFVAIPEPFYDHPHTQGGSPWNVDVGSLTITSSSFTAGNWHLISEHFESPVAYEQPDVKGYWASVDQHLTPECLSRIASTSKNDEKIEWLTLCAIQKAAGADVALLQKRDFFSVIGVEPHGKPRQRPRYELQDLTDRIVWKGDFVVVANLPGSILQKVMAQSKAYDAEDGSSLSLSDETNRGLATIGIRYDSEQSEYVVNGLPLDPNKLYSIVTSDYVTGGDTGYPDLASSQANPLRNPGDLDARLRKISSVVCEAIATDPGECLGPIRRDDYFDDFEGKPLVTKRNNTNLESLKRWSIFFPPGPVRGEPASLTRRNPPSGKDAADQRVQTRPLWDFSVSKLTLGINALGHSGSDFDVQNNFGGVSAPGVNAVRTSTWASDLQAQYQRSWQSWQILLTPAYTFNTQYKGQPDDVRQINQQSDLATFDLAGVYLWTGRAAEHVDSILTVHFETPLARIFNAFQLGTTHLGQHGELIKDQLRFAQDRSYNTLLRPGFRWKRRKSFLEFGPETGHEWNALNGFDLTTGTLVTECLATANVSISQCVKNAVKTNPASITPTSIPTSLRSGHNHSGMYWNLGLTVPFHPKVSYVFTDTGDWLFVHYSSDNSTDTYFRDTEQHQLKLNIFPSLSIGPEVDLLFYKNASTHGLPGHFLRQDIVMMKAQFSFDLFNARKMSEELTYAPPATPK